MARDVFGLSSAGDFLANSETALVHRQKSATASQARAPIADSELAAIENGAFLAAASRGISMRWHGPRAARQHQLRAAILPNLSPKNRHRSQRRCGLGTAQGRDAGNYGKGVPAADGLNSRVCVQSG